MKKYNIGWGITNSCNMNCRFCYSKDTRSETKDCQIDDWKDFVDKNYRYIDSINYGTGENSLSADFFEFIDYVRKKYPDIAQSITTNGYIYEKVHNNRNLYNIYYNSIDEVDVSLDFCDKDKHNYFRGQPKAYDWALNTLRMLRKDNKKATIVFVGFDETMTKNNIDGLFEIAKKYNALLRLNIYRPVSTNKEINDKFILDYNILINSLEYINDKYEVVTLSDTLLGNMYSDVVVEENTGINSIRILADGSICPSTYLISEDYRSKYNIKNNSLVDITFEDFENAPIPDSCSKCPIKEKCRGGVFDRRILWYGTLEERDPYCPFNNNDNLENKKKFNLVKQERLSVHDGYLPTMFFRNGGK